MVKLALALTVLLLAATPAFAETLTDDSIVQLTQAGLGADAILAKIRASDTRFDVSTDAMVGLRRAGVPDTVIAAMVTSAAGGGVPARSGQPDDSADPAAPLAPGVYLLQPGTAARMQRLDPALADDSKVSGALAWILTNGIAPLKVTTILDNPTAHFRAETLRPVFYFFFNQPGSGLFRNGMGTMRLDSPASPAEFTLLRFTVVSGARQTFTQALGRLGPKAGDANAPVAFSYAEVAPGVFSVTPDVDLSPGEYAFEVTPANGDDDAETRFFDFSIADPAA